MSRRPALLVLRAGAAVAALALVAACGGSPAATGGTPAAPSTVPSASPAAPPSSEASPAGESPSASAVEEPSSSAAAGGGSTIALQAVDFGFNGPDTAQAGVTTITLENTGKEEHQAQLVRINDDKSFDDLTAALATGDPTAALALVTVSGGPTAVRPGATGETTQTLTSGNYAFLCFISGADGIPHVAKGMIRPLTVTGPDAAGTPPAGDATVTGRDFTFDVTGPVGSGEHTFTFKNDGPQPHEAGVVKLTGEMSVDQIKAIFSGTPDPSAPPPSGPPPFEDEGGIGAIAPGTSATFKVTLEPGQQYAFICFVPDPATGKAHAELGMITAIPTQ